MHLQWTLLYKEVNNLLLQYNDCCFKTFYTIVYLENKNCLALLWIPCSAICAIFVIVKLGLWTSLNIYSKIEQSIPRITNSYITKEEKMLNVSNSSNITLLELVEHKTCIKGISKENMQWIYKKLHFT